MNVFKDILRSLFGTALLVFMMYFLFDSFLIQMKGYPSEADRDTFVQTELTDFYIEYRKNSPRENYVYIKDDKNTYSFHQRHTPMTKREEYLKQIDEEEKLYITYGTQIIDNTEVHPVVEMHSDDTVYITAEEIFKESRSNKIGAYVGIVPLELLLLVGVIGCVYVGLPLNKPRKKSKSKKRR